MRIFFTVTVITVCILLSNECSFAGTAIFSYDSLNRLTNVDYGNGSVISYTYDPAGNRLTYSGAAANDTIAPSIAITNPTSGPNFTTSNTTVNLSGIASDNTGVSLITWANDRGGIGTATGTNSWAVRNISLAIGTNVITLTAYDAAGNTGTVTLTVMYAPAGLVPPLIVAQPVSQTVAPGGSVTFNVSASGTSPLSYFWSRNGLPIAGATASSYTTNNVQLADSGSLFTCLVSNVYGTVLSSTAMLTVTLPSLVQNGGFELGNFAGWTTTGNIGSCYVVANGLFVHWGGYGAELGSSGSPGYLSQTLATSVGQTYKISCWLYCDGETPNEFSVSWNDATLFNQTNVAATTNLPGAWTNLQFQASATASNTVLTFGFRDDPNYLGLDDITAYAIGAAPTVVTQPASQVVTVGGGATFAVSAAGSLPLSYFWRRGGVAIAGATASSYTTNNVQLFDSGSQFSCLVSNAYGTALSSSATLTVVSNAPAGLVVGVLAPGNTSEFNALGSTLTNLGFPVRVVTNAPWTGVNVVLSYPGCYTSTNGPSLTDIANGLGYVEISDWGSNWTPVTWVPLAAGAPITITHQSLA